METRKWMVISTHCKPLFFIVKGRLGLSLRDIGNFFFFRWENILSISDNMNETYDMKYMLGN